jgi:hypothetical protein
MESKLSRRERAAVVFVSLVIIGLFSGLVWLWLVSDATVTPTVASGTCVGFDCSGSPNSLNANPAGVTCQADHCLATECCTSSTGGDDCTTPDPVTTGYDISNVTGSLSKDSFSITGVRCASGYGGTASANACSVAGQAYTLTGCSVSTQPVGSEDDDDSSSGDCIPPDPVTTGYDISNVTGSLSKDSFSITGVRCASGYGGTASANACSVAGQAYTLTGCSVSDSGGIGEGGGSNNCDANEPDLTNSNMNAITADSCDGTAIGRTCDHTCNGMHTGGSVTCRADGTWAVVACDQSATTVAPGGEFYMGDIGDDCTEVCRKLSKSCIQDQIDNEFLSQGDVETILSNLQCLEITGQTWGGSQECSALVAHQNTLWNDYGGGYFAPLVPFVMYPPSSIGGWVYVGFKSNEDEMGSTTCVGNVDGIARICKCAS